MDAATANKYVRIHPRFKLRGWLDQPYALVDHLTATALFVPKAVFNTLKMCNGSFCPADIVFHGPRKRFLEQLEHEGVLAFSDEPSSLEPDQEYRYYPNHYMRQVQWSMTGRCNYRCRHCFMSAPHGVLPQPSTEECLRIADQIAECGVQVVKLTGGECLIRKDFLRIIDRLLEGGVQIATILSNGALITEELLCALEERSVCCGFDISFDGTDGWHDWLRGVKGAEEAAIRAFKLCREHGFPTGAQIVLHRDSAPTLRNTVRLLAELGVMSAIVSTIESEGEAHGISKYLLDYDESFSLFCDYLPQFLEDGAPMPKLILGGFFEIVQGVPRLAHGREDYGDDCVDQPVCGTVRSTMYVSPDGFILPCIPMSYDDTLKERFPNVASMTLAEALTDSSYYDLITATAGDVFDRNPKCQACAYKSRCKGGCRAKGVDKDGNADPMGLDTESCRFYLGGYYDRAREFLENLKVAP